MNKMSRRDNSRSRLDSEKMNGRSSSTVSLPRRRSLSATRTPITKFNTDRVVLNCGGKKFVTLRTTLKNIPDTLLFELEYFEEYYDDLKQEYFFDRSAEMFEYVLNFHRTGELHFAHHLCPGLVQKEMKFWRVKEHWLEDCCWNRFMEFFEKKKTETRVEKILKAADHSTLFGRTAKLCQHCTGHVDHWETLTPKEIAFGVMRRMYTTLRILQLTLQESMAELGFFMGMLAVLMIVCGIFICIVDRNFSNPIHGMYWVVATMTTVGYGTNAPTGILGCIIGTLLMLLGIACVVIVLPVVTKRFVTNTGYLDHQLFLRETRHQAGHSHTPVATTNMDNYIKQKT